MGINATSLALIRLSDNLVETFLRLDVSETWQPPEGYYVLPDDELPEGYQRVPEEQPQVPKSISARQIRLWLIQHNYTLSQIDGIINQIPDELQKNTVMVEWEYAPYIERNHFWINILGEELGLNPSQIDQAFIEASTI
jgi:hypothetical protein